MKTPTAQRAREACSCLTYARAASGHATECGARAVLERAASAERTIRRLAEAGRRRKALERHRRAMEARDEAQEAKTAATRALAEAQAELRAARRALEDLAAD